MFWVLAIFCVLAALAIVYALWGRAWVKKQPWALSFFAVVEPWELTLFKKSETILFARLKMVTGILLTVLTQMGSIDLSPITPFLSAEYQGYVTIFVNLLPMTLVVVGWIDEYLRKNTTLPLEVVALPIDAPPEITRAADMAVVAKTEATAVIQQAKAEGKV